MQIQESTLEIYTQFTFVNKHIAARLRYSGGNYLVFNRIRYSLVSLSK